MGVVLLEKQWPFTHGSTAAAGAALRHAATQIADSVAFSS
jgi:hypothetical protein